MTSRSTYRRHPALIAATLLTLLLVAALAGCSSINIGSGPATTVTGVTTPTAGSGATVTTTAATTLTTGPVTGGMPVSPAQAVAAGAGPSVVNVAVSGNVTGATAGGQQYSGVGSGVIYSADGYIVTNAHVVSDSGTPADSIEVTFSSGEKATGRIIAIDQFTDLAVIKVDKTGLPVAAFAPDAAVTIGEWAIAIGSPSDYRNSVTLGIVSGVGRTLQESGSPSLVGLIQTDAAISPGNSGGALLDSQGRVIGINVAYLPPGSTGAENIAFAIPADTAVSIANELIANGKASHPYLGIQYTSVTTDLQTQLSLSRSTGALVQDVSPGTPAQQAGIQQGDIIVSIDGNPVVQQGDIVVQLRKKKVGDTISLVLDRNGAELTVQATLVERPASLQ